MKSLVSSGQSLMIVGGGVSGRSCLELLTRFSHPLVVVDNDPLIREQCQALAPHQVSAVDSTEAVQQLDDIGLIITSPGWRPDTPLFQAAAEKGIEIVGDVELAWRLDRAGTFGEPRRWLGITGTNGKSTTTAMLAGIMKEVDPATLAVGNIGMAVSEALRVPERINTLVVELSSFQLYWCSTLAPDCGAVLNLAEDHLDWHGGMDNYAMSKMFLLNSTIGIAGIDDPTVRKYLHRFGHDHDVIGFSAHPPQPGQVGVEHGRIIDYTGSEPVVLASAEGIDPPGPAGVLDAVAAAAMAYQCGAQPEHIQRGLQNFQVASHRGQVIFDSHGIRAIDNSKATNPHAAHSALSGVDNILWFGGGQLKGADVQPLLTEHVPRIRAAFLLGADRHLIAKVLRKISPDLPVVISESTDPEAAMKELVAASATIAQPGDTLVLAPAAASLDMFQGMGHRGDVFHQAVYDVYSGS
ncbi:UDP-N-acetylmuramoyl-L-alanine--D-glutamate ligase [Corynebacterium poyangense]|uniref:UDP-N-acetylmuramoylalanine--D-glutamate ligase n=1 Tax=Corynebacterium poyangense TaxID=2684405 RepID=A0A7H0SPT5_9CORY|nr:UDP-N-acetylmuramoyl-L-alanine--D-glutamate ligase [Corynebacterium poyangense]QNQ90560.1 UDP-N-acetylmuramoyl-L-alanine--D-glutamate ligase [Corynebacterium poyangense]